VAYDWRPTATRSATTDPSIVVASPRDATFAATSPSRPDAITMAAAIDEFIEAAEAGRAFNRSGRPYKPSALRDLCGILEYHVFPELGDLQLRGVRREHIRALVDRLGAERLSESRIRSVVSALRALYGYAIERRHVEFNPADAGDASRGRGWPDRRPRRLLDGRAPRPRSRSLAMERLTRRAVAGPARVDGLARADGLALALQPAAREAPALEPHAAGRRVVEVDEAVVDEVRIDREAEKAALALSAHRKARGRRERAQSGRPQRRPLAFGSAPEAGSRRSRDARPGGAPAKGATRPQGFPEVPGGAGRRA
jgi:hypothetical protein